MITKNVSNKGQVQIVSLDQLVPEDHILRKIDRSVDFSFIYDLVEVVWYKKVDSLFSRIS